MCVRTSGWVGGWVGGLELQMGEHVGAMRALTHTSSLPSSPHHQMVVNGAPIGALYDQLQMFVCAASPVEGRPEACYRWAAGGGGSL